MLISNEILPGLLAYALALWLGAYLIARDISEPRLTLAGLGLGGFALAIATNLLAATLFFSLGIGLLLFPLDLLPRSWVLLGTGFDLILLGFAIAMLDAFEQGENLRADMIHSLGSAALITILFSGQVIIAMALWTGASQRTQDHPGGKHQTTETIHRFRSVSSSRTGRLPHFTLVSS